MKCASPLVVVSLAASLSAEAQSPRTQLQPSPSSPSTQSPLQALACRTLDIRDPRYFVNIVEREPGRTARVIYSAAAARAAVCADASERDQSGSSMNSTTEPQVAERSVEISSRSRLEIDFDREWIEGQMPTGFDAIIRMSAKYTRGEKSQPLEIPSYYSTGVDSKPLRVLVSSLGPVNDLLLGLANIGGALDSEAARPEIAALERALKADSARAQTQDDRKRIDDARKRLTRFALVLDTIDNARSKVQDPASLAQFVDSSVKAANLTPDDSAARADFVSKLMTSDSYAAAQRTRVAQLNAIAASVRESIARESKELGRISIAPASDTAEKRARVEAAVILRAAPEIRAVISSLHRIDADSGATVLSMFMKESPAVTRVAVSTIGSRLSELDSLLRSPATSSNQIDEAIRSVRKQMKLLSGARLADAEGQRKLIRTRLAALRGTQILIPSTVLTDGDNIELTIRNLDGPNDGDWDRVFISRVTVRAFGLSTVFRDAALLVKRTGVNESRNDADVTAAFVGGATEKRVEQPVNYRATPGASISWGYQPRLDVPGATLLRWLQPTAGLHVSAPQFNSTVTRLVDGVRKVETVANEQHVGAGAIVSVFNNKISLAVGRVVTAREKKNYLAIGFSFVSLANGAVSLTDGR